ncbi:MAG TPA: methyltransferase domain-containing protein [Opitutaceae bacterium]|nr:methyltransferase domain-containing protein [Opitutaceae bacterium]
MNAGDSLPVGQHDVEIQANRQAWQRKPQLRAVYRGFHELIASRVDRRIPGQIVELGSGMGSIKEVIPECVTTDLFPNPWLDRQENAYRLSYPDGGISNLILFDVWHHLRYPSTALAEFRRVLAPGGRVIIFDPAISWTGRLVYGLFHHEPVGLRLPVTWEAPAGFRPSDADYFAAQGAATRIFWRREAPGRLAKWDLCEVTPLASFEYLATGGFSGPRIGGPAMFRFWRSVDHALSRWPKLFAARLLVVLKKTQ